MVKDSPITSAKKPKRQQKVDEGKSLICVLLEHIYHEFLSSRDTLWRIPCLGLSGHSIFLDFALELQKKRLAHRLMAANGALNM